MSAAQTIEIPKSVADRLAKAAVADHEAWQQSERTAALQQLAEIDAKWREEAPALDAEIEQAAEELAAAESAFLAAKAKHGAAQIERNRRSYQASHDRDLILRRLDDELLDGTLAEALENLSVAENEARELGQTKIATETRTAIQHRLQWIRQTGRPALNKLKTSIAPTAEIRAAVAKLMEEIPAV